MPVLTVRFEDRVRTIPFVAGQSIRDILDATDIRVRAGCNGGGACGLCRVRIESGSAPKPTLKERTILERSLRAEGIRLACQVKPKRNVQVAILNPARQSNWRTLPEEKGCKIPKRSAFPLREFSPRKTPPYGVAVDLGTSHISISLHNLATGQRLAGRIGSNPQMNDGSDIMTRLVAASGSHEQALQMGRSVRAAIGEALQDIATRDGINISEVVRFALVGNTAMLALLSGQNYALLTQPRHWAGDIDCLPEDPGAWAADWGFDPDAVMEILPPLAGFVGSDLLAGVLATHMTDSNEKALFIDFGTNSEIALWDGEVLWVTSAAGGPAFEGSGFTCGMPAEPGAIYRVRFRKETAALSTIDGENARGLCGSGIIDLIAGLAGRGILTEKGRFAPEYPQEGFVVADRDQPIVLVKRDVDLFQRAKAAIGTGIQVLLENGGMKYSDLRHIYIGGIFGHFLDVRNARKIGLLPMIPPACIHLCGNTALNGCELALLSSEAGKQLKHIRGNAHIINLSQCPDFDDIFLENLYLRASGRINA
ncbi:MAG: ASKHA domain-containing protein [Methanoregula sp.]|nr:ASKHA domain-containing protein [Methanoregula sp.]